MQLNSSSRGSYASSSLQFSTKKELIRMYTSVVKLQSWVRMRIAKRKYRQAISENVIKRKYFTREEFWETIQTTKIPFNFSQTPIRQFKEHSFICNQGAYYSGFWRGGFRDGRGTMKWPDGAVYEGFWVLGQAVGEGKFKHANGDTYQGQWYCDKAQGQGTYTSASSGGTYTGSWFNDLQHGRGIEVWKDSSVYEGEFKEGEKHGSGKQVWHDGSIFIGKWESNMINGVGKQKWVDGRIYEGEFFRNLMHGFGKFTFVDGKSYEGFYKCDKKHGFGVFKWSGKQQTRVFEGWWTEGKQDGCGIIYEQSVDGSEQKIFVVFKEGIKVSQEVNESMIEDIGMYTKPESYIKKQREVMIQLEKIDFLLL